MNPHNIRGDLVTVEGLAAPAPAVAPIVLLLSKVVKEERSGLSFTKRPLLLTIEIFTIHFRKFTLYNWEKL